MVTAPQASLAVAVANNGVSGHSSRCCQVIALNTGGVLSATVITCDAVAVLPQASVAVNVLVRVYSLAHAPELLHQRCDCNGAAGITCCCCTK